MQRDTFKVKDFLLGERGHIIGDDGLCDDLEASYSVVALTGLVLYEIAVKKLREVCKESEQVQEQLFRGSVKKRKLIERRMRQMQYKTKETKAREEVLETN